MTKTVHKMFIIFLAIFSFYYTNKIIDILKQYDPIMKQIKETESKYYIAPINAQIVGDNIISGKNGQTIDYEESYNKMKKYGTYNETLTTLKEEAPTISITDNYDKYIVRGNTSKRNIALVFKITSTEDPTKILAILNNKKVPATFFIDGTYLEKHTYLLKNIKNHELELLSYDSKTDENLFKTSLAYLETITKEKTKYCYTETDNESLLSTCSKLKMHTIKPTIVLKKNLYKEIKNNLSNSIIISLEINNYVEKELPIVIDYIYSKDYNFTTIDTLIMEDN